MFTLCYSPVAAVGPINHRIGMKVGEISAYYELSMCGVRTSDEVNLSEAPQAQRRRVEVAAALDDCQWAMDRLDLLAPRYPQVNLIWLQPAAPAAQLRVPAIDRVHFNAIERRLPHAMDQVPN
jgi:hypothetical protein